MRSRSTQIAPVRLSLSTPLTNTLNSDRAKRRSLPKIERISRQELKKRSTDFIKILPSKKIKRRFIRQSNLEKGFFSNGKDIVQSKDRIDYQSEIIHRQRKKKNLRLIRGEWSCCCILFCLYLLILLGALIGTLLILFLPSNKNATTTTTHPPIISLLRSNDPIFALYNTTAGDSTGGFDGIYSPNPTERTPSAIDGNLNTKYVNGGPSVSQTNNSLYRGIDSGFFITPTIHFGTIAVGFRFGVANDVPLRDPLSITLEGTNSTALNTSSVWTLIYSGPTGIDLNPNVTRLTYGALQNFSNTIAYQSYRLLVTAKRGDSSWVQYSEFELWGYY